MKGYRSESLFGDGVTDPKEVALYETQELGNAAIPEWLLDNCPQLTEEEREHLEELCDEGEVDEDIFGGIVERYLDGRNFCKWLCPTPEDVWGYYVEPMPDHVTLEEFMETEDISEYEIPEDAVKLADLGAEGVLWAWRE